MAETLNWHDAHALLLIDQALEQGRFTDDVVEEITQALREAGRFSSRGLLPITRAMSGSTRLTLLHCSTCSRSKAHTVERIDGLLTWTCSRCGTVVKQPPAPRRA